MVGTGPTYITINVDGLDPKDMPGTGSPEPGGYDMSATQIMLPGPVADREVIIERLEGNLAVAPEIRSLDELEKSIGPELLEGFDGPAQDITVSGW